MMAGADMPRSASVLEHKKMCNFVFSDAVLLLLGLADHPPRLLHTKVSLLAYREGYHQALAGFGPKRGHRVP
jgi:hypothetical protein